MSKLSDRQAAVVLAIALFFSYAYFYQAGGWNQNARFALVRAVLERHTLRIDAYEGSTGDKARSKGHYYSDKAPGASLLALAPAAAARLVSRLIRIDPDGDRGIAWTSYVATVFTSGLFTLAAALVVMRLTLRWGFSRGAAFFAAAAYGIASPAWCYATLFMGHGISAGCLMLAYASAVEVSEHQPRHSEPPFLVREKRHAWLAGLWAGLAVLTEFPAAVPSFLIVLLALLAFRDRGWQNMATGAVQIVAGGMIAGIVLLAHNALAFRSPLSLGYAVVDSPLGQLHTGFFGITYPAWWRLREILVGSYRGLLPISPLVAVTPIGLLMLARVPARRRAAFVAVAIAAFYVLFNASYYYWEGGWAYGPRQMMAALPFLALGLAPLWDSWGRCGRVALSAGLFWGAALTLIAVSTTPQPPSTVEAPVHELLWPAFRDGDLSLNNQSFVTYRAQADRLRDHPELHASWNLGEIAGLHGLPSLLPLGAAWSVAAALLSL